MLDLRKALVDYEADFLTAIAELWDIEIVSTGQPAMLEELVGALVDPDTIEEMWKSLSAEEQEALRALQAQEGRMLLSHFVRRYGEIRPMGPARRARERPWRSPANITEVLYYRALVAHAFAQAPVGAQEYIYIPSELLELLPPLPPDAAHRPPGHATSPPLKLESGQDIAPDDLTTLLAYLRIRPTNARAWLTPQPVPFVDRHLRRPNEPIYRALLTQLAYDLGLIEDETETEAGQPETYVASENARPWLEAPRWHQLRSLAEAWQTSPAWNDLAYTPGLEADTWPNDPLVSRKAVIETLALVPAEFWWSLDSFVDFIKETNPDFQRPGGDYSVWYLHDAYTGEVLHGYQRWNEIEGALIQFLVEGPMRWLGLAQVGRGVFRLTQLGLALLHREDWPSGPDQEAHITIDSHGLISVPAMLSRYQRLQLARFAAWLSPPTIDAEGGIYLYRLTAQSLERAQAQGILLRSHVVPFLQRLSGRGLPENVLEMLEVWEERPDQVVIHDAVVLEAKDLGVDERLKRNPHVRQWLERPLGPHAYMIMHQELPSLLNALLDMGILPNVRSHPRDETS